MSDAGPITLETLEHEDAPLLANLLELYSHDLSGVFGLEVGPDGRFGYDRLPVYWSEPQRRSAYLIRRGSSIAGFVLTQKGSPLPGLTADQDVTEFFVLRAHRDSGVGREAAFQLWDRGTGSWMIRVADGNAAAQAFWEAVIHAYTAGEFSRDRRTVDGRDWHVFVFASR